MGYANVAAMIAAVLLFGCEGGSEKIGGDVNTDGTHDPSVDSLVDTAVDSGDDGTPDIVPDSIADTVDATDVPTDIPVEHCTEAATCPGAPPDGLMGAPCLGDGACDSIERASCTSESLDRYDGEDYVYNPGGNCSLWSGGMSSCDPETDEGCPPGSRCIYIGEGWMGIQYGCFDACEPGEPSGDLHDWACGCRMGYSCNLSYGACFTGCSNDRECCESWVDENMDSDRDAGEVTFHADCSSYCDGDDPEETADCMASYECVNPGITGALFGDPCVHDYQCPVDGYCLTYVDPSTGEDYYPGGYCSRLGCEWAGRGCTDAGGWCLNSGSYYDPAGMCIRPCHVGREISDPGYECRTAAGQEHACHPMDDFGWIGGPPAGGQDGYCFPGNFGSGSAALGSLCADAGDCASPLGLGDCLDYFGGIPFCTISCNQSLAQDSGICGLAGTGGIAAGVCGWNMCFDGCDSPGAALGASGCGRDDMACAPLSTFGSTTFVASGALRPPGYCMPACDSDSFCAPLFGTGATCDTVSGVCSW